jgi:hypothetical protein
LKRKKYLQYNIIIYPHPDLPRQLAGEGGFGSFSPLGEKGKGVYYSIYSLIYLYWEGTKITIF